MRVLVCGGRDFFDKSTIFNVLSIFPISFLIHGDAPGADTLAGLWAKENGIPFKAYPLDRDRDGTRAGAIRNRKMLTESEPEWIIAFPGGPGTRNMLKIARANMKASGFVKRIIEIKGNENEAAD